jgi:hypothetical protein
MYQHEQQERQLTTPLENMRLSVNDVKRRSEMNADIKDHYFAAELQI